MNLAVFSLIAVPSTTLVAAVYTARQPANKARLLALWSASLAFACSLAPWLFASTLVHPWLVLDALNAPLVSLVALITLAVSLAGPKRVLTSRALSYLLWTELSVVVSLVSARPWVVALSLLLGLLPMYLTIRTQADEARHTVRSFAIFVTSGTLLLSCALVSLEFSGVHLLSAPAMRRAAAALSEPGAWVGHGALLLLWLGVLMRMAVVPVHSWLLVMFEKGPLGIALLLLCANPGAYLVARLGLPYTSGQSWPMLGLLGNVALVTAVYGAFLTIAQRDLRRVVAFVALSQSGLILVGLGSQSAVGVAGAFVHWAGSSLALTGLALCAWSVQTRTGTTDMADLRGMSRRAPGLAGLFAAFALASAGTPFALTFVSEDLLMNGAHGRFPHAAAAIVVASALNSIALVRAYFKVFLGSEPESASTAPIDLVPRERVALCLLLTSLLALTAFPGSLTKAFEPGQDDVPAPPSHVH